MLIRRGFPARFHRPIALTIGNFDGVHLGHRALLSRLKTAANSRKLAAAVLTFEPHPREFFAPHVAPARLTSLRDKCALLAGSGVDVLHVQRFDSRFAQVSAEQFVRDIEISGARYVLVGDDFRFGKDRSGDFAFLERGNFELERMDSVAVDSERVSSSAIRAALATGDLARASRFLGRVYSISGRVVHGDRLGAKIGFSTANVQMKNQRPPLTGIFAVETSGIEDQRLPGVASLGVRPTIYQNGEPTLEVHLFDFDAKIYGRRIAVFFLHKLRDEAKYADLQTLTEQIARDVEDARIWFGDRE